MFFKVFRSHIRENNASGPRGFTLIEILVVLTILGLMAALVIPNVIQKLKGSKEKIARTQIANLENAVEMYYLDMGSYPPNLQALVQPGPAPWDGPYLKKGKDVPKDPWGDEYQYEITDGGESYRITSTHLKEESD